MHIFNIQPGVNPMDKARAVINEAHGFGLGKSGPVASGDEGNAEAVKARCHPGLAKEFVDSPILITAEEARCIGSFSFQTLKEWSKPIVNRNRKILPWIILFTLGVSQPNSSGCQVDVFHWDQALRKTATCIERNFKANPHPFRLILQLVPDSGNVSIRQFRLLFLSGATDTETGEGIGLGKLAPDRFVHQLRRPIYLGVFSLPSDAARAYDEAALRLYGTEAFTNASAGLLKGEAL